MLGIQQEQETLLANELRRSPLDFNWRMRHGMAYLVSSILFLIGSFQFFTWSKEDYTFAAITFILGGLGFFYADVSEWYINKRFDDDYENQVMKIHEKEYTCYGRWRRAENSLNYAFSAFGSFLYLIGCCLFWPSYNASVLGTHFFIWGSEVVCLSQCWKLYRSGCNSPSDPISTKFKLANLTFDKTATLVDLFAFVGGVQYLIGCIYFLPEYNVSDYHTNLAATLFVLGGISFTFSGLILQYRYFVAEIPQYSHH